MAVRGVACARSRRRKLAGAAAAAVAQVLSAPAGPVLLDGSCRA
ncbi:MULTISPECIES: hypothetical protein [Frankia]|nr:MULTISPECIES: hypothetical protein [Frankia]